MKIDVKYAVGDKIRYWRIDRKERYATCGCCGGLGWIEGKDKYNYPCPECDEFGKILAGVEEIKVEDEGTISAVHVHYDSNIMTKKGYGVVNIYYSLPQKAEHIQQEDIIGKITDN